MQVVRDQMRQVQHRLQQERLRDARPFQGVPHRVFPLCSLQPTAHPGRRIRAAGGWAFLPRGPRRGRESQPRSWRPSQSPASGAASANGRYFSTGGKPGWEKVGGVGGATWGTQFRKWPALNSARALCLSSKFPHPLCLDCPSTQLHVCLYMGAQPTPLVHTCTHKPKLYCQLYFGLQPIAY